MGHAPRHPPLAKRPQGAGHPEPEFRPIRSGLVAVKPPSSRQEREKGRAPAFGWGEGMCQPSDTRPLRKGRKERGTPETEFRRTRSGLVAEKPRPLAKNARRAGHPLLGGVRACASPPAPAPCEKAARSGAPPKLNFVGQGPGWSPKNPALSPRTREGQGTRFW